MKMEIILIKLKDILNEGVYDKSSLKAVIMCGGPGSGKTTLVRDLFGFDETLKNANLSSTGFKIIDIDYYFQNVLKKRGFSLDLNTLSKTIPNWEEIRKQIRDVSHTTMIKQGKLFLDERLGVILDGVQDNVDKLMIRKTQLEELGYDVIVIFVDVPLETALERNQKRDRKLEEDIVISMWENCQSNKEELKRILGDKFKITSTDDTTKIRKTVLSFLNEPIKNPIGKSWIKLQMDLKNKLKNSNL